MSRFVTLLTVTLLTGVLCYSDLAQRLSAWRQQTRVIYVHERDSHPHVAWSYTLFPILHQKIAWHYWHWICIRCTKFQILCPYRFHVCSMICNCGSDFTALWELSVCRMNNYEGLIGLPPRLPKNFVTLLTKNLRHKVGVQTATQNFCDEIHKYAILKYSNPSFEK